MGNSITSIREISRINFLKLFEEINGVEEILKSDPAGIYSNMDYQTKEYYRNKVKELANKTKISENYVAKKALKLCEDKQDKKAHIGYYLIGDGYLQLLKELNIKTKHLKTNEEKANLYINSVFVVSFIFSLFLGVSIYYQFKSLVIAILTVLLSYIPISEIYVQILNYILVKSVKPKLIPKMELNSNVPENLSTMVVIPTIINSREKVQDLMKKMEVYYLANKSENIYFTLLGDCTSSKNKIEDFDEEVIEEGIKECLRLNKKYANGTKDKFYFAYRNRTWNAGEGCYLGWERKRGLLSEFNKFLLKGIDKFKVNTIKEKLNIKYIITLDSDTNLIVNSAFKLIGAMTHILNRPVINERRNLVVEGHGIIQPRVGIDLEASRKSLFTKIYAGQGGTDVYTNAISDVYQDNFDEGIFTGKGIYDLEVFYKVLNDEIPKNTVLSHDLLEGNYLRCGLATDILLIDGYPAKYNSYITRLARWVRGDWQLLPWLSKTITIKNETKKRNPLNKLSKFKILDNLRRSLTEVLATIALILVLLVKIILNKNMYSLFFVALTAVLMPTILDLLNYIIFKKTPDPNFISAHKNMTKVINVIKASIIRGILEIAVLPYKTYILSSSIIKTIYRLKVSKQNLLEWMTAEEAEKQSKKDLLSYYKNMIINPIVGALLILFGILIKNYMFLLFGILFTIAPYCVWYISREIKEKKALEMIDNKDKEYILEVGKRTWQFFKDNLNEKNNFLMPDNIQEDRKERVANRTSPTNIGLSLLAVISAYDLGYSELSETMNLITKMLKTIEKLPKWNGHLYNWYNTLNLEPLNPKYISTVDSGNFVGYLYTLKTFLIKNNAEEFLIELVTKLIVDTNFTVLYDDKKRLFSIGFNIDENKQTDSYYDLLASEARQASLIAIAKKDVDVKHWNGLSRTLTSLNKYKGLISWSGTAFEYLMPNVNIKRYEGSLLDESCRFMIMSQKEYAKKLRYPLGDIRSSI